ncbi:MAG: Uma2 family endonuclease [Egibacteraceae bacterium]
MQLEVEPPFVLVKPVADERAFYDLADEDAPWELLDGRLVMSPVSERHQDLFGFLSTLLRGWLDERGGGVVRGSRYPMRLDPRWSPEPDLLVVTDAHLDRITRQRLEGPADLVIEIASDGDPCFDEREKLPRYRAAGIPEIWLASPQTRSIRVDRLDAGGLQQPASTGTAAAGSTQPSCQASGSTRRGCGSTRCPRPSPACGLSSTERDHRASTGPLKAG